MLPVGCSDADNFDRMLPALRWMVRSAFKEAAGDRTRQEIAVTVMGIARYVAIDLLVERGMSRKEAKRTVDRCTTQLKEMTDWAAKEAGLM